MKTCKLPALEKDKSKWKTAKDKKELLAKIEARLAQIPGITIPPVSD